MEKLKKYVTALILVFSTALYATYTNAFWPFTGIIEKFKNTLVGTILGAVPDAFSNVAYQISTIPNTWDYSNEPGNYSFFWSVYEAFRPSPKWPYHTLTSRDTLNGYVLPKSDQQVWKGFPGAFQWQKVELDGETTGARCSNGSNYKFFVNLTPTSDNFIIFLEGGGACFDYETCSNIRYETDDSGKVKLDANGKPTILQNKLSQANPNGISDKYLDIVDAIFFDQSEIVSRISSNLASPLTSRIHPGERARSKVHNWNYIYMPYCTGDVHIGDNLKVFQSKQNPLDRRVMHFAGTTNMLATIGWMRTNLPKPGQVLVTGQSAGSAASEMHRVLIERFLNPERMYSLLDSGFALAENPTSVRDDVKYPGDSVMKLMRKEWLNYEPTDNGTERKPLSLLKAILPEFDLHNLDSLGPAYNKQYPAGRTTFVAALNDIVYSSYAYQFNPAFDEAAVKDGAINKRWPDRFNSNLAKYSIENWRNSLKTLRDSVDKQNDNVGYYMPSGRRFNGSHCLTALNYDGVSMSRGGTKVIDVINNLVDAKNPKVIREVEVADKQMGLYEPLSSFHKLMMKLEPSRFEPVD